MKEWCYSFNGEDYEETFNSRKGAIEDALDRHKEEEREEEFIFIGQAKDIFLGVNVDRILEEIGEEAYDKVGDLADSYLMDVTIGHQSILEKRLNEVLHSWMEEFKYKPHFWEVVSAEEIRVSDYL